MCTDQSNDLWSCDVAAFIQSRRLLIPKTVDMSRSKCIWFAKENELEKCDRTVPGSNLNRFIDDALTVVLRTPFECRLFPFFNAEK